MLFKLTRQNWAFWNDYIYHTRKNFLDVQKISGLQCYPATGVYGPLCISTLHYAAIPRSMQFLSATLQYAVV